MALGMGVDSAVRPEHHPDRNATILFGYLE